MSSNFRIMLDCDQIKSLIEGGTVTIHRKSSGLFGKSHKIDLAFTDIGYQRMSIIIDDASQKLENQ